MKLTIVCKGTEWQVERLSEAAHRFRIDVEVRDITEAETDSSDFGEVVLWRSSSLGTGEERLRMMRAIRHDGHILINRSLSVFPHVAEKWFQQEYLREKTDIVEGIATYRFESRSELLKAVSRGELRYPFIRKPNKGSKGKGVVLITDENGLCRTDSEVEMNVYQNFIRNSGDYRVFILGGKMLGVIRRMASDGGFINNISLGGTAERVSDPDILKKLRHIGTTVASVFELTLCGVDVIYDEDRKKYVFLEVNTVPQWKGFQEATGIDVAGKILSYCDRLVCRKTKDPYEVVLDEYLTSERFLGEKRFHFFSRMYLWTKESRYKEVLDDLRGGYIGFSEVEYRDRLKHLFVNIPAHGEKMIARERRLKYFAKYPELDAYLAILFKYLFAGTIYDIDLRPYIRELVSDDALIGLKNALERDTDAVRVLSTHAINFLYLVEHYLGRDIAPVDPEALYEIGETYPEQDASDLKIYLFTHCIIGASGFYSRNIVPRDLEIYRKMLRRLEAVIGANFREISLDNKFEFLVCANICGFSSELEKRILDEAATSFSPDGNFIIDMENTKSAPDARNDFAGSEHRNVLYLMSQRPFQSDIERKI